MENLINPVIVKPPEKKNNIIKVVIFLIIIFGFITAFVSGFYLHKILENENIGYKFSGKISPTPTQMRTNIKTTEKDEILPEPVQNKRFFEDTIMLVSKSDPRLSMIATVSKQEQDSGYTQNNRASFFDGNSWKRVAKSEKTSDSTFKSNSLISEWNQDIDPSRVLRESMNGEINIENKKINFSTSILQNEISMRSLPGYTKFMSNGQGTITVDGNSYPANVVYTKIYSLNSSDIQFYNQPFGLTTDWVAFWDNEGDFYHIDRTDLSKPTEIYRPHEIGIVEESNGSMMKTFNVSVGRDNSTPPKSYNINLGNPVNKTLKLNLVNSINKVPSGSYKWFMGQVTGTATNNIGNEINGFGIVEYINN